MIDRSEPFLAPWANSSSCTAAVVEIKANQINGICKELMSADASKQRNLIRRFAYLATLCCCLRRLRAG
jgi:hypothetical protein